MKLLYCPKCQDVRKLKFKKTFCQCRRSWAYYQEDGRYAVCNTFAVLLGLGWTSLEKALKNKTNPMLVTHEFKAWVIGSDSEYVEVQDEIQSKDSKDSIGTQD